MLFPTLCFMLVFENLLLVIPTTWIMSGTQNLNSWYMVCDRLTRLISASLSIINMLLSEQNTFILTAFNWLKESLILWGIEQFSYACLSFFEEWAMHVVVVICGLHGPCMCVMIRSRHDRFIMFRLIRNVSSKKRKHMIC